MKLSLRLLVCAMCTLFSCGVMRSQTVTSFTLQDTNGNPMVNPIVNNQTIFVNQLSSQAFTIRANVTGSPARVTFTLTKVNTHTQLGAHNADSAPFTVCGNSDCSGYFPAASSCGNTYLLQAVPFSVVGGNYIAGVPYTIAFSIADGTGLPITQNSSGSSITITPHTGDNEIVIDDGPSFATPVADQTFSGSTYTVSNVQALGLVQGVTYNFKSKPSGTTATCVIQPTKWNLLMPQSDYLQEMWNGPGRGSLAYGGQMTYSNSQWSIMNPDPFATALTSQSTASNYQVGQYAEYADTVLTPIVSEAQQHFDLSKIDELSQYYLQFLTATASVVLPGNVTATTIGARVMQKKDIHTVGVAEGLPTTQIDSSYYSTAWPDTTRTIVTYLSGQIQECPLCNEIFLYPAARLVRLVSTVPPAQRTSNMTSFVQKYISDSTFPTSFLVDDQIIRYVFNYKVSLGTCSQYLPGLSDPTDTYDMWTYQVAHYSSRSNNSLECFAMVNNNVYLAGMATEILGAYANDPTLVPLTSAQVTKLQNLVQNSISLFKLKQNSHPTTDFAGNSASAVSYFDDDLVELGTTLLDDSAFACLSSSAYPTAKCNLPGVQPNPEPLVSWDTSHYYQLPVFLRTLFDNKKAINSLTGNFPAPSDLQYAGQQFVYNVMRNHTQSGAQQYPVFGNYADGTDGWYRVGYNGTGSGYAPSSSCDAHATNPPQNISTGPWVCLMAPGVAPGWGALTPFSSDLGLIQQNLISLAQATDSTSRTFRDLHYYDVNRGLPFAFLDSSGNVIYPTGLINVLYLNAAQIQ